MIKQEYHDCGDFVTATWVNSTGCSGEFHVVFKHFQNLENLILKEKLHISCLVSLYNSTVQTATISEAAIKFWSKFHIQFLWFSFIRDNRFLLTPSSLSQENRKILPLALLDTTVMIVNSIMEGWKYRSSKLLKAIFCHQKNRKKADTFSKFVWNFLQTFAWNLFNI